MIGRYEKSVRRMIRLKGCDWPIWKCCLGDCPKDAPKVLIRRDEATCPYDDASDLSSCQNDLIGWEGKLVFSSGTRMIGLSDGLVLLERFWLADLLICFQRLLLASLSRDCRQPNAIEEKTITRKRLLSATNTPFWSVLDAKTDKMNLTFVYLLYPWGSNVTVHYANDVAR